MIVLSPERISAGCSHGSWVAAGAGAVRLHPQKMTRAAITGLRKAGFEIERLAGEDGTKAARYRLAGKAA